ncbi:hypothetical protein AYO40_03055 [Planctomycetaceae bacterium SCGC AG-212-D15]|nr:hypothetical protein AYO40_03055 [Planctomycetaceae bacterium SCGC AG-212-D15]
MRTLCLLLLAISAGAGCIHMPFTDNDNPKGPKGSATPSTVERRPVMPDQVKETTAHRIAQSLDEEVAIDETTPVVKPVIPEDKKK